MLTYHEILRRNTRALLGYDPPAHVQTRDINYLLRLIDRYTRYVQAATTTPPQPPPTQTIHMHPRTTSTTHA